MSRIISGGVWGLALAAIAAFSAVPAAAASDGSGAISPHILLVRGGGGGGGHGGGGGFGGGHGGFSGGGFSGGSAHSFATNGGNVGGHAFAGNSHAFAGNEGNFGNRGGVGYDGYGRGGWNNAGYAWRGNGYGYGGFGLGFGLGYGLGYWGGYGWYPGYYGYGYNYYPSGYYGDNYAYADNTVPESTTAVQPPQQNNQVADQGGSEYLDQAVQDFQGGNYQNAMRMAEHAIVDSPRDAEAHEIVSLAAMANKDYRTAATEAHAVIALGGVPSWSQVYGIYQNVDAYTSQMRALEDYVKANPKSAEGQFLLGVQYMTTGYSSEAHDHLALASQLTPKDKIAQDLVKGAGGEQPSTANRPGPETK
jgi:hypothetical protein